VVALTDRPTRSSGHQAWRDLLFLHWEVPAQALQRLVPPELTIDTFEGRAFVGVVPFMMRDVRLGPARLRPFQETNVRAYVHAQGVPGVWFLSLDAQSALAVWGGRALFGLPYFRAAIHCSSNEGTTRYALERRGSPSARWKVQWTVEESAAHHAVAGTLEHFLTERYALYGSSRGRAPYRIRVHHPPWPLQRARIEALEGSLLEPVGLGMGRLLDLVVASPEGVAVETFEREQVVL
jgi:uncharacterized protein YqjF (DUF2071 family)